MSPTELLNEFRTTGSGSAFAGLTRHYLPLVLGVARRRVNDPAMAEDIAQAVFVKLAQAAPKIDSDAELTSWLHRTTLNASIDAWRSDARRRSRETEAAMDPTLTHSTAPQAWLQIAPEIDELVQNLPETDRRMVLLRFFDQLSMAEAGQRLGISEDAAKMRVGRALDKLRSALAAKGVTCSSALLADLLSQHLLEPATSALLQRCAELTTQATASTTLPLATTVARSPFGAFLTLPRIAAMIMAVATITTALRWNSPRTVPASTEQSADASTSTADPEHLTPFGVRVLKRLARSTESSSSVDLDAAQAALRAALNRPPRSSQHPPTALLRALSLFQGRYEVALPILLESANTADYETRAWSLSGIQYVLQTTPLEPVSGDLPARSALRDQVRPLAGSILLNRQESSFLRSLALSILLPPVITINGAPPPASSPDVEAWGLVGKVLTNGDSRDLDFRLGVLDQIKASRMPVSLNSEHESLLRQGLTSASARERLIAASSLVALGLPLGVDTGQVKTVLLQELQAAEAQSYRAAQALGRMGAAAADVVPALLSYAEAKKDWPSGYASSALEAACRLDPTVRAQHPEISSRLSMEEPSAQPRTTYSSSFAEHLSALYKQGEEVLRCSLVAGIDSIGQRDPEAGAQARERLLASLEQELAASPENARPALEKAVELVRNSPLPKPIVEPEPSPLPLENLLMDARVLLVDNPHPKQRELESMLEEFREHHRTEGKGTEVTTVNFKELATRLESLDPAFRKEWERSVMKNYPWLDRVVGQHTAGTK